jgi:hypothetical protein
MSWQLRHTQGFPLWGRRPIATDFDRFDWLELGGARETDLRPISTSRDHPTSCVRLCGASSSTSFNPHRQVCPGYTTSTIVGPSFSRLPPARTGLPWFHTSIVGALFSRPLQVPARVPHQAALSLGHARTTMTDN